MRFSMSLPVEKREELMAEPMDQIYKFQLSAVGIGDSIHLFYSCGSLAEFEKLQGFYSSGQLTSDLHTIFTLHLSSDKHVNVNVSSLSWQAGVGYLRTTPLCTRETDNIGRSL